MKVVKWISLDELKNFNERIEHLWTTCGIGSLREQYQKAEYNENYEDAIIKELVDNQYIICGDTHQYICIPVFEKNEYIMLSMRKWGEIMAKAMNLIEGLDKYTYKDFYLISLCKKEEKLPIK